jgi:hypothetical protein
MKRSITDEEKRRLEGTPTETSICQTHTTTHPPTTLDAPPRQWIKGMDFIPSLESPRRHAILSKTQTSTKLKNIFQKTQPSC